MLQNLGYDINRSVSMFLNGFHNEVQIQYYRYLGETGNYGVYTPQYAPPITVTVQQQNPSPKAMEYVRKNIDIKDVKQFWASWEIEPVSRIGDKGGDMIKYLNDWFYVESVPDDFRQTGWMSVIGVRTFEPGIA